MITSVVGGRELGYGRRMQRSFSPGLFSLGLVTVLFAPSFGCPGGGEETDSDATVSTSTTKGTTTDATVGTTTDATVGTTTDASTTHGTDPTDGGGGDGQFCFEECAADMDCTLMGMDQGFTCQEGRCTSDVGGCTANEECQALFSGWVTECQDDAGCPGQVCIDIGDPNAGRCATPPSDFLMCETIMQSEIMAKKFMDGSDVAVCANTSSECHPDGYCFDPCASNDECVNVPGHPQCNTNTGGCECATDDDCKNAGVAGFAVCNAGVCGCGADADCAGNENADKCYNGACGCSSVDVCQGAQVFDGTMKVCEKP